jgi:hypothetical protein
MLNQTVNNQSQEIQELKQTINNLETQLAGYDLQMAKYDVRLQELETPPTTTTAATTAGPTTTAAPTTTASPPTTATTTTATTAATTSAECIDTADWVNDRGYNCDTYKNNYLCINGVIGSYTGTGSRWNFPEDNCCVCGKGNQGAKRKKRSADSMLVANEKRCSGTLESVEGFFTLYECASKCKEMIPNDASFIYFMHAFSAKKCQGLKCLCQCNIKKKCEQKDADVWNLYNVSKGMGMYAIL